MMFALLLASGTIALIVQKCFLTPPWLRGADWALIPLIVIYGCLFLPASGAWLLAFSVGLFTDLLSEARLGSNVIGLILMTFLLQTQEMKRWRTRWYLQMIAALTGTMFYMAISYFSFCIQQGRLPSNYMLLDVLQKMTITAIFNCIIAPVAFVILSSGLRWMGCRLPEDTSYHDS